MLCRTPRMTVISLACEDVGGTVPFVFFGGLRADTPPESPRTVLCRGDNLLDKAHWATRHCMHDHATLSSAVNPTP